MTNAILALNSKKNYLQEAQLAFKPVLAITVFLGVFVSIDVVSLTTYVNDKPHQQKQQKK